MIVLPYESTGKKVHSWYVDIFINLVLIATELSWDWEVERQKEVRQKRKQLSKAPHEWKLQ